MSSIPRPGRALALTLTLAASGLIAACSSAPEGPVTETGELATGDLTLVRGEFYDRYTVQMGEGQWIKMDLRSPTFDPYLVFRTPGGQQSDMDDSTPGDTTRVELIHHATEAGQYEIVVTSFATGETGAYTLVYEVTDAEPASGGTSTAEAAPGRLMDRPDRARDESEADGEAATEDGPTLVPDGLGPNVVRPSPAEDTSGLGGGIKI